MICIMGLIGMGMAFISWIVIISKLFLEMGWSTLAGIAQFGAQLLDTLF